MSYNGYPNYETWIAQLWISNDKSFYRMVQELAREHIDSRYHLATAIEAAIKDYALDSLVEKKYGTMISDLLMSAIAEIDWRTLARHAMESILDEALDDIELYELVDDGTLDTVIRFCGQDFQFSDTSEYRDEDGSLDLESLIVDNRDAFEEVCDG